MTDDYETELRHLRQEREIYSLRAKVAQLERRCDKLQRMHDNDQTYIARLQSKLKRDLAETVFGADDG